ncbi:MAG: hypothetical protein ACI4FO_02850 [Acutalibacteraceae bacterium]
MCHLFNEWKSEIKNYCKANNLDFEKAQKMARSCGKNDIALLYIDKANESKGLLDDTPAPVVLWIRKSKDGKLIFEQTEYTNKCLQ